MRPGAGAVDATPAELVGAFFAGALLLNAVPHLVAGITGRRFESPFGRPSSAGVNVLWAAVNVVAGALILYRSQPTHAWLPEGGALIALTVGGLLTAAILGRWFARDGHGYC